MDIRVTAQDAIKAVHGLAENVPRAGDSLAVKSIKEFGKSASDLQALVDLLKTTINTRIPGIVPEPSPMLALDDKGRL